MTVEHYQKAIEFSQWKLAEAAPKLTDTDISMRDRQCAFSDQTTERNFLKLNQDNLNYAQQSLKDSQDIGVGTEPDQPTSLNGVIMR